MSRLAQTKLQRKKDEADEAKRQKQDTKTDKRNIASKLFDAVNLADSGRSFTTEKPTEEGSKKSAGDSLKDVASTLFSGTEKVGDAISALSGQSARDEDELTRKYNAKEISLEEYQKKLKERQKDTEWAGTEDKGVGDRIKKAAGVTLEAASEVIPVGKGAKVAKEATEQGVSKLARFKIAKDLAEKNAVLGVAGGTGGSLADDTVDVTTDEGRSKLAQNALLSGAVGGVLGGGTSMLPIKGLNEEGSIRRPFNAKIGDELQSRIDSGHIDGKIDSAKVDDLTLGTESHGGELELDPAAVEDYKARIRRGDEIDPIVIGRNADGVDAVQDGAHRLQAAKELGIKDIPVVRQLDNVVMASKVEPPTSVTLSQPIQLKVLDPIQREADVRSPGDVTVPAKQTTETKTQQGAQYIVDDINKFEDDLTKEFAPVDRDVAGMLTGDTSKAQVKRTKWDEFKSALGNQFQDSLTVAARTTGKTGTDFVYDMLKGNKFKRDALDNLREPMRDLAQLNKKLTKGSTIQKRSIGAKVAKALDDRANADTILTTPQEKQLFDGYVKVFDYVKDLREKAGLETLDNYRPWVNMKDASEPPTWLADSITDKKTTTLSRFSKERTREAPSEDVDNNLADMIYGYVNSQLNELAYDAPVRRFKSRAGELSAADKANTANLEEGLQYLQELTHQAVSPDRKNAIERFVGARTSNVYGSILPFNVKLAFQNKTQKLVANSRVSKGARKLANSMDEADLKELEPGLVFGDSTVYGQLDETLPETGKAKFSDKVKKIDPYQRSEHNNVITSYNKGAMQAVIDSDQYKAAVKSGSSKKDAAKLALQDPQVKENAIRRGNIVVNDTQFGASPLARPAALRQEGSIMGIPKKTLTMFVRFPIGMSNHILENLNTNNARALELLKNGDPRASSIAEMRGNFKALLETMKESKTAVDQGADIGIPQEVLNEQIKAVSKNLSIIDKEAKKLSQVRGGKTTKNLAKMWAAAAAIQIVFDGGVQSFADDPEGVGTEALVKANPTATGKVVGQNSVLAGLTSAASPIDRRGGINERGITNAIPGVGLVLNRGRDIKKLADSLMGTNEE